MNTESWLVVVGLLVSTLQVLVMFVLADLKADVRELRNAVGLGERRTHARTH